MRHISWLTATAIACAVVAQLAAAQSIVARASGDSPSSHPRAASVAASSPSDVRVEARANRIWVRAQADVDADSATIWSTLSDYDHLSQFIPDMASSRTIARSGTYAIVEQRGNAGFGPIRQSFVILLAVMEVQYESIHSSGIGGDFGYYDARYEIVSLAPNRSRIVYEATLGPNIAIPALISVPVMRSLISNQFGALVQEVMRRAA